MEAFQKARPKLKISTLNDRSARSQPVTLSALSGVKVQCYEARWREHGYQCPRPMLRKSTIVGFKRSPCHNFGTNRFPCRATMLLQAIRLSFEEKLTIIDVDR